MRSQNVSPNTGVMLRMRRTERSSHYSWIKIITLCTWRSPAAWFASPSVAVSVMDPAKSKLMFLSLPWVLQRGELWWWDNPSSVLFGFIQVLCCISGPILWLVKPGNLWQSDPRDAVSMPCHISQDLLRAACLLWVSKARHFRKMPVVLLLFFSSSLFFFDVGEVKKEKEEKRKRKERKKKSGAVIRKGDCKQDNTWGKWVERINNSFSSLKHSSGQMLNRRNTHFSKLCWNVLFFFFFSAHFTNRSVFLVLLWLSLVSLWRLLTEDFFAFHNHSAGGYEQDTEYGNTAHLGDCHGKPRSSFPFWQFFLTTFAREHYFTISLLMTQDTYHLAFNLNFAKAELFGHGDVLEKNLTFFFPSPFTIL